MLTSSTNIMQEEWVQRWLDKLTPKQQALVIEVLKDFNNQRQPTPAAVAQANAALMNSNRRVPASVLPVTISIGNSRI